MKYIKRIFAILILTVSIIVGIVFYQGYDLYKNAISKLSIEQMVKDIRNQENFCTIDELPDDYINAVIAVEDRRFYKHNGIDII